MEFIIIIAIIFAVINANNKKKQAEQQKQAQQRQADVRSLLPAQAKGREVRGGALAEQPTAARRSFARPAESRAMAEA
ncbi:MAG: hypothetical protein KIC63_09975 [Clostridium sp.]|nr:hypothetical protein [Clostridium sp.]